MGLDFADDILVKMVIEILQVKRKEESGVVVW